MKNNSLKLNKSKKKIWIFPIPVLIVAVILFLAGGGYLIYALTKSTEGSGPVGYWKFDEGSGVVAYDSSGNINHGILTNFDFNNDSGWKVGKVAGALKFDGTNDYVNVPDNANLDFGSGDFTVAFWIRRDSTSETKGFIAKADNDNPEAASSPGFHIGYRSSDIGY
ncbi:MAG: hypothetical protein PHE96_13870, partial [Methylococcales bacterium]|nr:hypothetical protein [Methylococcales bacterium]